MNFSGRYYTESQLLVAVHPAVNPTEHLVWEGHDIPLEKAGEVRQMFGWDKHGNCVKYVVDGIEQDETAYPMERFNIWRVANPQTYADSIEVVGCEGCAEYLRKSGKRGK
jgi:hypothetical protein